MTFVVLGSPYGTAKNFVKFFLFLRNITSLSSLNKWAGQVQFPALLFVYWPRPVRKLLPVPGPHRFMGP